MNIKLIETFMNADDNEEEENGTHCLKLTAIQVRVDHLRLRGTCDLNQSNSRSGPQFIKKSGKHTLNVKRNFSINIVRLVHL